MTKTRARSNLGHCWTVFQPFLLHPENVIRDSVTETLIHVTAILAPMLTVNFRVEILDPVGIFIVDFSIKIVEAVVHSICLK